MRPGTRRTRSSGTSGLTVVELIIASLVGFVVVAGAGIVFFRAESGFRTGAKKVIAQQEATLLSTTISRAVRVGDTFQIYNVPNRVTPADSGDGVSIFDEAGALIGRLELDPALETLVDINGNPVNPRKLAEMKFVADPALPRLLRYRFATDDEEGNTIDIESSIAVRN